MQGNIESVVRSIRGVQDHVVKVAEAYQRISKSHQRKEQAYDKLIRSEDERDAVVAEMKRLMKAGEWTGYAAGFVEAAASYRFMPIPADAPMSVTGEGGSS